MGKDVAVLGGVTAVVLGDADWWILLGGFIAMALAPVCMIFSLALLITAHQTLRKVLNRVAPSNRLMEPGSVWLNLIPVFGFIWSFFIATRIPQSLRNEFRDRAQDDGSDYGKRIGLVYATAYAAFGAFYFPMRMLARIPNPEMLGMVWLLLGLASLVLFFIFLFKIARYGDLLAAPPNSLEGGPDFPDDEGDSR